MKSETKEINNGFITTLGAMRKGKSIDELSEALAALVQKVRDTGKAGELIYKIKVGPARDDASALVLVDEINSKNPKANRLGTIFYATDDNRLQREDPNQSKLPLRIVEKDEEEKPLKKAAAQG